MTPPRAAAPLAESERGKRNGVNVANTTALPRLLPNNSSTQCSHSGKRRVSLNLDFNSARIFKLKIVAFILTSISLAQDKSYLFLALFLKDIKIITRLTLKIIKNNLINQP
jgi:hypothetical protein